jgi:uncharacterized membrane protein YedE/YeeE
MESYPVYTAETASTEQNSFYFKHKETIRDGFIVIMIAICLFLLILFVFLPMSYKSDNLSNNEKIKYFAKKQLYKNNEIYMGPNDDRIEKTNGKKVGMTIPSLVSAGLTTIIFGFIFGIGAYTKYSNNIAPKK